MVSLEDLGLSSKHKPSEKAYKNLTKVSQFMLGHVLKDSLEVYGAENIREDYYQMFLCSHKYYTDPILVQMAIVLNSGNDKPIPAPAYKAYVKHKVLGPVMVSLFSYPIYGKEDGYDNKEKSLQYSVECFLNQERILVFPEGQIAHDGLLLEGRLGSAEIAWRAYHLIQQDEKLRSKKKGLKIIPMDVSYYPIAGIPWKDMDKMTVRFGKPIDFEEEVIERFHYFKKSVPEEELKRSLQKRLMKKVTKSISSLATINMENIASRVICYYVGKEMPSIRIKTLENKLNDIVKALNGSGSLYLIDNLKSEEGIKKSYKRFIKRCKKKHVIKKYGAELLFNLDYILSKPDFKDVRNENFILYNRNLLEHSREFKEIIAKEFMKEREGF